MSLVRSLHSLVSRPTSARGPGLRPSHPAPRFRPTLESLEDRVTPSAAAVLAPPVLAPALVSPAAAPAHHVTSMVPLSITGVVAQAGQLVAQGLLGSLPFTAPLTLTTQPAPAGADCPILDLHLGPIHLDVLGLTVDTSEICLSITAESGPGNLLGNLLCDVSHLLDGGVSLDLVLGGLSTNQLTTLTSGLTSILNGVLSGLTSPSAVSGASCGILDLSLGPVDLNLLGLDVHLDNCDDGPVTLTIAAEPGPGNLLGNLLCSLTHVLDSNASATGLLSRLDRIAHEIGSLL